MEYVDNISAYLKGIVRQLKTVMYFINGLHPNITFPTEFEKNNKINFLKLTISRVSGKLKFSIFHKPPHTVITTVVASLTS